MKSRFIVRGILKSLILFPFLCLAAVPALAGNVKVGAILAITGPASFLGGPELRALEMAVEEINGSGGLAGSMIELVVKDSGGSPEKAVSFARQLIEEEKVFAIIGPSTSGETLKVKNIAEQGRTLLFSCASAELIVKPVAAYVFKTAPSDSLAARRIFMTMREMGISKIAVLVGNTGFGKAGKAQLTAIAPEYGIDIVASETYDKDATDLSAAVAKIRASSEVQAVVNWSIVPAQSILARNIRQAGWEVPIFQSHGFASMKYVEAAGEAAEGIIFPASPLIIADRLPPGPRNDFLAEFKKKYETRYNEPVSTFGGHSYDAMLLLQEGIKSAGTIDKEKVRQAVEQITGLIGTAGVFNMSPQDHNGLGLDAFSMFTVKDGRFELLEE